MAFDTVKKSLGGMVIGVGVSAAASPALEMMGFPQNEYSLAEKLVEASILQYDPSLTPAKELLVELTYGYITSSHAAECPRFIASACYIPADRRLEVAFRLAMTQDIVKRLNSGFPAAPAEPEPKKPGLAI